MPQVEHHHDVSPEEKVCSECQREKTCIGEEISRVLEFVPGQLEVHNHHLKKYACPCGQCGVTTAPVPLKPIEKCIAGPGLLSSLIVSKTGDHLPTYRSEDILVRHGLHIPRSTLCDWNVFTTDGRLTIDNNLSERTVRALAIGRKNWLFIGSEPAAYRMAVLITITANAKRHHLEPFAYVRDLLVQMSSLCAACGVVIPDFTEISDLTGPAFRELGMSLASQLPEEALSAMLPDHWAAANPKQVLVHRIEEARQVANRKRDDRQKRREKAAAAELRQADAAGR